MTVGPSVGPSTGHAGKSMILVAGGDISCNVIIMRSFHQHEDASLALWALLINTSKKFVRGNSITIGLSLTLLKNYENYDLYGL